MSNNTSTLTASVLGRFVLCSFVLLPLPELGTGCGKSTEAKGQGSKTPPPAAASSPPSHPGAMNVPDPVGGGGGGGPPMPSLTALKEEVLVSLDEVEIGSSPAPVRASAATSVPVHVKVTVTSKRETLRPFVAPKRFTVVEGQGGGQHAALSRSRKEPPLTAQYLKKDEKVSGWLTFQVPSTAKEVHLETNLTTPPQRFSLPSLPRSE